MDWLDSFYTAIGEGAGGHIGWAEMATRALVIFLYGVVVTRIGGWRAFGRWSTPDIIVTIIVGSNLSRALTGPAPLLSTMFATTVFLAAWALVSFAASRSHWLDWLFKGEAIRLITDGSVDRDALHKAVVSRRDLEEGLRQKGVAQPLRIVAAYLERNGSITVIRDEDVK
jgi:uncharacterized membrane protein YcaP (DUF421 family)